MTLSSTRGPGDLRVLVMAKAPVPGQAKTRLGAVVGDDAAAELAAAALLDTLGAATAAVGAGSCVLALAGDLQATPAEHEIRLALAGWLVVPQRGDGFDQRLAHAHADAGPGPLVQVGMDTPQLTPDLLLGAGAALESHDVALGPAEDGGWWVLGRRDPLVARALIGVEMSTAHTGSDTRAALLARGLTVADLPRLRDVDEVPDADAVAAAAPHTRFARAWTRAHLRAPAPAPTREAASR